jgi:hypothetical protein
MEHRVTQPRSRTVTLSFEHLFSCSIGSVVSVPSASARSDRIPYITTENCEQFAHTQQSLPRPHACDGKHASASIEAQIE